MFDRSPEAKARSQQRALERTAKRMAAELAEFALFADESMFADMTGLMPATDDSPEIRDAR